MLLQNEVFFKKGCVLSIYFLLKKPGYRQKAIDVKIKGCVLCISFLKTGYLKRYMLKVSSVSCVSDVKSGNTRTRDQSTATFSRPHTPARTIMHSFTAIVESEFPCSENNNTSRITRNKTNCVLHAACGTVLYNGRLFTEHVV